MPLTRPDGSLGRPGQVAVVLILIAGALAGGLSPLGLLFLISFSGVGAILVIRRPGTLIGWLLLVQGWSFGLITMTVPGTVQSFADGTADVYANAFAVVQNFSGPAAFLLFAILAAVFPSGRLPTGRWGTVGRAALGIGLAMLGAGAVMPVISINLAHAAPNILVPNPLAVLPDLAIWQVLRPDTVVFPVIFVFVASAISLVFRARSATGIERQQLRWFAASIAFVVSAILSGFGISLALPGSAESGLAWIPAIVAFPTVPAAIGIAVLRHRLYEIDRIISRTVAYALLTATLGLVYAATIVALQAVLAPFTSGSTLAVAASTLLVAAIFAPLRSRLRRAVDRRFNRTRYDHSRTVEHMAGRLADLVDLEDLRDAVLWTVDGALQPTTTALWLRRTSTT